MKPALAERPDRPDVEAWMDEHGAYIGRLLARLVGEGPHVDDLLQDTFFIAHTKRDSFEGRSALRTWLAGIAIHRARHHRRSLRRFSFFGLAAPEREAPPQERPDAIVERGEARAAVHAALGRLPAKQREVFVLFELEEMEGPAIAELLAIPLGTVWTRLHHARKTFTRHMRAHRARENRS